MTPPPTPTSRQHLFRVSISNPQDGGLATHSRHSFVSATTAREALLLTIPSTLAKDLVFRTDGPSTFVTIPPISDEQPTYTALYEALDLTITP